MPTKTKLAKDKDARARSGRSIQELVRIGYAPESALRQRSMVVRVSLEEYEAYCAAAEADGRTLSNWLRKVASEAAKKTAKR